MHEVSIMQNALDIAIAQARQSETAKIDCLTLNIGELSGVIPEALEFAFEVSSKGTIAENAQLEINFIPVLCHCQKCVAKPCRQAYRDFQSEKYIYQCPHCQKISSNIVAGRELELVSVVVSTQMASDS